MAYGTKGRLWPNATIPYEIDSGDFPLGSSDRTSIDLAITEWNDNTVVRLIPRSNEANYIIFKDVDTSCASTIGQKGGGQQITCDLEGGFSSGSIIHEIGHAVGLYHEHQRPDRVGFVTITGTTNPNNCDFVTDGKYLTDYDCGSIMHYGSNNCGSITPLGNCTGIGQRIRLSGRDIWGTSLLYNIPIRSVVVWEDDSDANEFFQIKSSAFSQTGSQCIGALTINTVAANQQRSPEVGMAGNGEMIFVWADDSDGNGKFDIKLRGFKNGRQYIQQKTVNVNTSGEQIRPDIAVANDGHFVVVWQDDTDGNGVYQIMVRGFNSDGSERFGVKTVNVIAQGQQTNPRVAIAPNGFFVVVWEDDNDGNGKKDIYMRGFNSSDGSQAWPFQPVSKRVGGNKRRPQLAMGPVGNFVVVWEDDTDDNKSYQIRMRAFFPNGNEKFSERTVNMTAAGQQLQPDVAVDANFQPVVVWADDKDKNGFYQIRMRGFKSNGAQRFSERTVNTDAAGQQLRPRIGMEANGNFAVVWEDDQDNDKQASILIRGFNVSGQEIFTTKQASSIPGGHKGLPSVVSPAMGLINPF